MILVVVSCIFLHKKKIEAFEFHERVIEEVSYKGFVLAPASSDKQISLRRIT